ncbi:hypothetical protein [Chitinimonas lacunae]|uniref:HTH cro/C1-type domain-containing protein n=1 Tax=Chitinimonas lacunae TaxID=1963018 RepID=A0ABV8MUX5_9NEIS
MERLHYTPTPAVLEREFNQRYWGKGVTLHGVRRWLRGEALPTQDKLVVLAEWLGMTPQELRYGDEVVKRIESRRRRWAPELVYGERETLDAFLGLPPPQRRVVREVILAFARAYGEAPEPDEAES